MPASAHEHIIEFSHVSKAFSGHQAVRDLHFGVRPRELVSIVGVTGCGKSTTFNLILGLAPPSEGQVRVNGRDPHADFDWFRRRIAVVFQDSRLLPWRTAVQNVHAGMKFAGVPKGEWDGRARSWLSRLGLGRPGIRLPTRAVRRAAAAGGTRAGIFRRSRHHLVRRVLLGAGRGDRPRPPPGVRGPRPRQRQDRRGDHPFDRRGARDRRPGARAAPSRPHRRRHRRPGRSGRPGARRPPPARPGRDDARRRRRGWRGGRRRQASRARTRPG